MSYSKVEVDLQNLLDHTASRILDLQFEVSKDKPGINMNHLALIGKWGFDGSFGLMSINNVLIARL